MEIDRGKLMMINKSETACLTGHRPKSLPWGYDEERENCLSFKIELKKIFNGAIKYGLTTFLTGMAEGFDIISAEILLELRKVNKIRVIAVVPCLNQELKWKTSQKERYKNILSKCDDVIVLSKRYYDGCMNDRNKFMVEHASVCIACWNGKPSGTGNTVNFAKANGVKLRIINPDEFV